VAGQGGAVAAVQVDVLVAVDVPDLRAAAVTQPDRLRRGDLPAGSDAAGEVLFGLLGQPGGGGWRRTKISSCSAMISLSLMSVDLVSVSLVSVDASVVTSEAPSLD